MTTTTERHLMIAANGKEYTIRTITVGQNFGTAAQVVARNGRVMATTEAFPLGFHSAAIKAGVQMANRL